MSLLLLIASAVLNFNGPDGNTFSTPAIYHDLAKVSVQKLTKLHNGKYNTL